MLLWYRVGWLGNKIGLGQSGQFLLQLSHLSLNILNLNQDMWRRVQAHERLLLLQLLQSPTVVYD
jgi:hypothetical protein